MITFWQADPGIVYNSWADLHYDTSKIWIVVDGFKERSCRSIDSDSCLFGIFWKEQDVVCCWVEGCKVELWAGMGGTWVTCRGHVSVGNVSKWSSLLRAPGCKCICAVAVLLSHAQSSRKWGNISFKVPCLMNNFEHSRNLTVSVN